MKNFSYVASDCNNKRTKGTYQAETEQDVKNYLAERGLFCISCVPALGGSKSIKKFKTKQLSIICRQLASMLSSGLTLIKALDILYKQQEDKGAHDCWEQIYESVQKGSSFSDSIKAQQGVFPEFFISMVSAGESSGNLDLVMNRLSDHFIKESSLSNKIKSAMIYPIILLVLSVVVVIGVFTFIMPTFKAMFVDTKMPALTQVMFKFSDFMREKWYLLALIVGGIVGLVMYLLRNPASRYKIDRWITKSRLIGKLVSKVYVGRFARTMSSLYSSGIPMVESIERSAAVLGNSFLTKQFETIVADVQQGGSLSNALLKADIFESMFCSMIYVGEEAGKLDEILAKTADYYEEESDAAISKLVSMIEPIMIIFLGVIIGLVVLSIYPAMVSMYDNVN